MAMYGDDEILYPIDDSNQEVYISMSSLKNQNFRNESDDDEQFLQKNMLDRPDNQSKNLNTYYCAICGRNCVIVNSKLEKLPTRLTDGSIIVNTEKYFWKNYLQPGKFRAIRREEGIDLIMESKCECGCVIGYFSLNHLEKYEEYIKTNFVEKVMELSKTFYVINDSIVMQPKFAQVFLEIPKRQIALKNMIGR